jgi:hypothetical protein
MPSAAAIGKLSTDARSRLSAAADRIAKALDVPVPDASVKKTANPHHAQAVVLDRLASWAEALADKVAPLPKAPEPKEEAKAEPKAEAAPESQPEAVAGIASAVVENAAKSEDTDESADEDEHPENPRRRGRPRKHT